MSEFEIVLTGPVMPLIRDGLEARFPVHKLHEIADKEAFFATKAQDIRGMVGGSGHGRIDGALMQRFPNLGIVGILAWAMMASMQSGQASTALS